MKIITNPVNLDTLKTQIENIYRLSTISDFWMYGLEIISNPWIPPTRPTGRLIGPDKIARNRNGYSAKWGRFTILEESDLSWALNLGLVKEEEEMIFYLIYG